MNIYLHGHDEHYRGPEAAAEEEKLLLSGPFWSKDVDCQGVTSETSLVFQRSDAKTQSGMSLYARCPGVSVYRD